MTVRLLVECCFFLLCGVEIGTTRDLIKDGGCAKVALVILGIYVFFMK